MLVTRILKKTFLYRPLKYALLKYKEILLNRNLDKEFKVFMKDGCKNRILFLLTPEYGNIGDHMIAEGAHNFFSDRLKAFKVDEIPLDNICLSSSKILRKYKNNYKYIVITGGGFLGNLYLRVEEFFRMILTIYDKQKIIVFPQSIYFENNEVGIMEMQKSKDYYNSKDNLHLFIRDKSYEYVRKEILYNKDNVENVPDIALYLNFTEFEIERKGVLLCLRSDKERVIDDFTKKSLIELLESKKKSVKITDTVVDYWIPISERKNEIDKKVNEFKSAELVITDRLHGVILSVITGTPCLFFDNATKKISGVYDLWLKDISNIKYSSFNSLSKDLEELIDMKPCKYSNDKFSEFWLKMEKQFND